MEATSNKAGAAPAHKPFFKSLYFQVLTAILLGVLLGHFYPATRRADEAVGRCLHQDDQDDHRADHLLHGGARHRQHAGHEEGRARRPQGAALLRGLDDAGADRRPDRGQHAAARCRHEHRSEDDRYQGDPRLCGKVQGTEHAPVPDGYHSEHRGGRVRTGRDPSGAFLRHPVRVWVASVGRARQGATGRHRPGKPRVLRRCRHHHEGGAHRRIRCDGVHHRQVRRGDAVFAGEADDRLLHDMHHLHRGRAGLLCMARWISTSSSSSATSRKSC